MGPPGSRTSGIHDYANREWHGLLDFSRERWSIYFSSLEDSLTKNESPKPIDWFVIDQNFSMQTNAYLSVPIGSAYEVVRDAIQKHAILQGRT